MYSHTALRDSPPDPAPPSVPPRNNYSTADSLRARLAGYMDGSGGGQQHDNALDDEGEYLSDVMGHYATPGEILDLVNVIKVLKFFGQLIEYFKIVVTIERSNIMQNGLSFHMHCIRFSHEELFPYCRRGEPRRSAS